MPTEPGAAVDARRHHVDPRTAVSLLTAPRTRAPSDCQLACHSRLSSRQHWQGVDSGDTKCCIQVGISPSLSHKQTACSTTSKHLEACDSPSRHLGSLLKRHGVVAAPAGIRKN